jgi:putative acetyltransferase
MIKIRNSRPSDGQRLVLIWRSAVDATHDFLDPADRDAIDRQVQGFLPESAVWLAVDELDRGIGFMGLDGDRVESLFIAASHRGIGVGRQLVEFALASNTELTTEVNEQNDQALGFFRHLGFEIFGRSLTDEDGRPFPLLHLRLAREA